MSSRHSSQKVYRSTFVLFLLYLSCTTFVQAEIGWPPNETIYYTEQSSCPSGDGGYNFLDPMPVEHIGPPTDNHLVFTVLRELYPEPKWKFFSEARDDRDGNDRVVLGGDIEIPFVRSRFVDTHKSGVEMCTSASGSRVEYTKSSDAAEPSPLRWIQLVSTNIDRYDTEDNSVYHFIDESGLSLPDDEPFYWSSSGEIDLYRHNDEPNNLTADTLEFFDNPWADHPPNDYAYAIFQMFLVEEIEVSPSLTKVYVHDGIKWGYKAGCAFPTLDFEDASVHGGDNADVAETLYWHSHGFGMWVNWKTTSGSWTYHDQPTIELRDEGDPINGFLCNRAASGEGQWDVEYGSSQGLGNYFLKSPATAESLAGVSISLTLKEEANSVSGQIWDIDAYDVVVEGTEQWEVKAYNTIMISSNTVPITSTLSPPGVSCGAGSLDGKPWTFNVIANGIRMVVLDFVGTRNMSLGFAVNDLEAVWPEAPPPPPAASLPFDDSDQCVDDASDE